MAATNAHQGVPSRRPSTIDLIAYSGVRAAVHRIVRKRIFLDDNKLQQFMEFYELGKSFSPSNLRSSLSLKSKIVLWISDGLFKFARTVYSIFYRHQIADAKEQIYNELLRYVKDSSEVPQITIENITSSAKKFASFDPECAFYYIAFLRKSGNLEPEVEKDLRELEETWIQRGYFFSTNSSEILVDATRSREILESFFKLVEFEVSTLTGGNKELFAQYLLPLTQLFYTDKSPSEILLCVKDRLRNFFNNNSIDANRLVAAHKTQTDGPSQELKELLFVQLMASCSNCSEEAQNELILLFKKAALKHPNPIAMQILFELRDGPFSWVNNFPVLKDIRAVLMEGETFERGESLILLAFERSEKSSEWIDDLVLSGHSQLHHEKINRQTFTELPSIDHPLNQTEERLHTTFYSSANGFSISLCLFKEARKLTLYLPKFINNDELLKMEDSKFPFIIMERFFRKIRSKEVEEAYHLHVLRWIEEQSNNSNGLNSLFVLFSASCLLLDEGLLSSSRQDQFEIEKLKARSALIDAVKQKSSTFPTLITEMDSLKDFTDLQLLRVTENCINGLMRA